MTISRKFSAFATAAMGLACVCILLSACSSNTKVNSLGEIIGLGKKWGEMPDQVQTLQNDKVHSLGETALLAFPTNQNPERIGAECAVNMAELYKTPGEAGIDETQVKTEGDLHYDFVTETPTFFDVSKANFLLCDIGIKNINLTSDDMNITMFSLVYLMPDEKQLRLVGFPAYFSESIDMLGNPRYYHFELPIDQSMDAKLGWWVDLEQCKKENLYVMYNHRGEEKIQQFWKLEL